MSSKNFCQGATDVCAMLMLAMTTSFPFADPLRKKS